MSVVPILSNGTRTIVATKEAFASADGENGSSLLILGLDREQLTGRSSNVSYDLRIGKEYKDHRDRGKFNLPETRYITLHPGAAVIVETEEYVHLPRSLFALVVPKVGLLQQGISNTMSKVDPGYEGHLLVTLFNLGQTTVKLKRRARFCSLCILQVADGATLYDKPGKSIEGYARTRWWHTLWDWVQRNNPTLTGLLILATLLLYFSQAC